MTPSRRDFLKIAGLSTLSLVAPAIVSPVWAKEKLTIPGGESFTAKRWGMAIDASKCPIGCVDCITACHGEHNVPDIGNTKHEVKSVSYTHLTLPTNREV